MNRVTSIKSKLISCVWAGLLAGATGVMTAQASSTIITFSVDMATNFANGSFNPPAPDGTGTNSVYVAGTFNSWASPGVKLVRAGASTVYTNTLNDTVDANGWTVNYKFKLDGNYETTTAADNRAAQLPVTSGASLMLPTPYYGDVGPGQVNNVTFQMDMTEQMQLGNFHPPVDQVEVRGAFNGWINSGLYLTNDPTISVTNVSGMVFSNVYTLTVPITHGSQVAGVPATNSTMEWKAVEDSSTGTTNYETLVSTNADGAGNRFFTDNTNQVLPVVSFSDLAYTPLPLPGPGPQILFVGNSFTHGAYAPVYTYNSAAIYDANGTGIGGIPGIFKKLSTQSGIQNNVTVEAVSSMTLEWHYQNRASIIGQTNWNVVVLQDQSTTPLPTNRGGTPSLFTQGVSDLSGLILATNPTAQVMLYETWAYPLWVYPSGAAYSGLALTNMQNDLTAAYRAAYTNFNCAGLAPVGEGFMEAVNEGVADLNPYDGISPGTFDLWYSDYKHPSIYGSYLSAATFYGLLTGIDPRTLSAEGNTAAADLGITPAQAATLNRIAYEFTGATNLPSTLLQAPTTLTLTSSGNPVTEGQTITFHATVNSTNALTGAVTFNSGSTVLGAVFLSGNNASLTLPAGAGTYSITASYDGDPNNQPCVSSTLVQVVQPYSGTNTVNAPLMQDGQDYPIQTGSTNSVNRGVWCVCSGNAASYSSKYINILAGDLTGTTTPQLQPLPNTINPEALLNLLVPNAASRNYGRSIGAAITSGSVYFSYLMNASVAPSSTDEIVLTFLPSNYTNNPNGLICTNPLSLHARRDPTASTNFNLGIERLGGTTAWSGKSLTVSNDYLVVVKYTFGSSGKCQLYINPTPGAAEPTADASATAGSTPETANIGRVSYWISFATTPTTTASFNCDVMRADANWLNVTPSVGESTAQATKLLLAPAAQSLKVNQQSALMTVTLTDQAGNPFTAASSTILTLASTSPGGQFYDNSGVFNLVTNLTIPAGSSSVSFYYSDSQGGSPVLSASSGLLTPASQTETVVAPTAASLGTVGISAGAIQFQVSGTAGFNYSVQTSTDLIVWTPVSTNAVPFTFSEAVNPDEPARYYRAVSSN